MLWRVQLGDNHCQISGEVGAVAGILGGKVMNSPFQIGQIPIRQIGQIGMAHGTMGKSKKRWSVYNAPVQKRGADVVCSLGQSNIINFDIRITNIFENHDQSGRGHCRIPQAIGS